MVPCQEGFSSLFGEVPICLKLNYLIKFTSYASYGMTIFSVIKKIGQGISVLLVISAFSSCVSNEKIMYYQNLEGNKVIQDGELISYELPEYRLQYNDIIDIQIQTVEQILENGLTSKIQNEANNAVFGQIAQSGGDIYYMTGYTIDKNGFIRMPLLGKSRSMT
jgi:polysaccharide biosynthesis/export protein